MIPTQVNDFAFVFRSEADDVFKKVAVLFGPFTIFAQLPAIDDVAVQDKGFAFVVFEKMKDFFGFAGFNTKVDVGEYNGFVKGFHN